MKNIFVRIISISLAIVIVLTFSACNAVSENPQNDSKETLNVPTSEKTSISTVRSESDESRIRELLFMYQEGVECGNPFSEARVFGFTVAEYDEMLETMREQIKNDYGSVESYIQETKKAVNKSEWWGYDPESNITEKEFEYYHNQIMSMKDYDDVIDYTVNMYTMMLQENKEPADYQIYYESIKIKQMLEENLDEALSDIEETHWETIEYGGNFLYNISDVQKVYCVSFVRRTSEGNTRNMEYYAVKTPQGIFLAA